MTEMTEVSKEVFFATVGPLDVNPRVDVASLKDRFHVSNWEMGDGSRKLVGRSKTDSWGTGNNQYWIVK